MAAAVLSAWTLWFVHRPLGDVEQRLDRLEAVARPPPPAELPGGRAPVLSSDSVTVLAKVIATEVRKELQATTAQRAAPKPETEASLAAHEQALAQLNAKVSDALQGSVLRREDVTELRRLEMEVGDQSAVEPLRRRLFQAMNQDKLRLEDPRFGPP